MLHKYVAIVLIDSWRRCGQFKSVHLIKITTVFSYLRTLTTWHCPHLLVRAVLRPRAAVATAVQQSIDISTPPSPQQQTRRTLLQRANRTDRRRDGHRTVS